jgi:RNA polymerase sigma factor (sigma-70 family)
MTRQARAGADPVSQSEPETLLGLVRQARLGDKTAWRDLIGRLKGLVWRVTADGGLSLADREDVFAVTFFRLFEHLDEIREPEKLPGWVATTARNEVRQIMRSRRRTEPRGEIERWENIDVMGVDEGLLDGELRTALQAAFLRLGCPCQQLLRLVSAVPPLSYDQVSQLMGVPRGAVGPTRQRCLERLRRSPELRPFLLGERP